MKILGFQSYIKNNRKRLMRSPLHISLFLKVIRFNANDQTCNKFSKNLRQVKLRFS